MNALLTQDEDQNDLFKVVNCNNDYRKKMR